MPKHFLGFLEEVPMNKLKYVQEEKKEEGRKGLIFNIQRFSVNDGPGVRSIVFLNGCPLRCKWCCNPESQELKSVIMFKAQNCVGCGNCEVVCPTGASNLNFPGKIDHTKCIVCGKCVDVCYHRALEQSGTWRTVEDIVKELYKDSTIYRKTGGGITFSGGEAFVQHEFLKELIEACKGLGWTTAIETTGYTSIEVLDKIVPLLDLVMMDIKHIHPLIHKEFTGVSNERILTNAYHIAELAKQMIIRVPVIPGFNADVDVIRAIAKFATSLPGVEELHLLPYHDLGSNKYGMLGKPYELYGVKTPEKDYMEVLKEIVEEEGLICKIGG